MLKWFRISPLSPLLFSRRGLKGEVIYEKSENHFVKSITIIFIIFQNEITKIHSERQTGLSLFFYEKFI